MGSKCLLVQALRRRGVRAILRGVEGVFVTGTGTGVGKSVVAAALTAALQGSGRRAVASKPVISGLAHHDGGWPHDHELLAAITGQDPDEISPVQFGPAVSPHFAARESGELLSPASLAAQVPRVPGAVAVVEGAGGLLVPLNDHDETIADLVRAIDLPLVVAASPGLGTINHTMLTLEAARHRGLEVAGVVLTPWPRHPTDIELDNLAFLTVHAGCPVLTLEYVPMPDPAALAQAGARARLPTLVRDPGDGDPAA